MRRSYEYRSEQCYYKQNWGNELHWNRLNRLNLTAIGYWLAENPDFTHGRAAHTRPSFARLEQLTAAVPTWASVTILLDAEVRGSKGTPQALKR
jgi:hypothetical protein